MKLTVEELPQSKREIQIDLEIEEINKRFDSSLNKLAGMANIPGFRKGKVPESVIKIKFGKNLQAEVLDQIVNESYEKAQKEKDIIPISAASIDTKGIMPEENKPYSFKITVDVTPTVKIDGYKELVLEKEKVEVKDEHVDAVLKRKQEEHAEFLPVTDRPAMKDDWVLLEGNVLLNGKTVQDFPGQLVQVGSNNLPKEISEALINSSAGDEKKVDSKTESGEKVTYNLKIKAIKKRRLLIVDDEFAKGLGGFQDLAELKADVRKNLERFRDMSIREDLKKQALDKLTAKVEVELPPGLIKRQKDYIETLSKIRKGKDAEELSKDELEKLAAKKLKESFLLDEIAEREKITVTDEELEKAKTEILQARKDTNIDMDNVRMNILHDKVFDFLLSHATINEKEESLILNPNEVSLLNHRNKQSGPEV